MSVNILNNCEFDLTKIKNLFIGSRTSLGSSIIYPIQYITVNDTSDSVIAITNWDYENNLITIGGQIVEVNEIVNTGDNITFVEDLVIGSNGKTYVKSLTFTITGINTFLINQIKEFTIASDGKFALSPTLALLIDENDNKLLLGYDNALYLNTQDSVIGIDNSITLSYSSISRSRARAWEVI